jgi:hypothetical protein
MARSGWRRRVPPRARGAGGGRRPQAGGGPRGGGDEAGGEGREARAGRARRGDFHRRGPGGGVPGRAVGPARVGRGARGGGRGRRGAGAGLPLPVGTGRGGDGDQGQVHHHRRIGGHAEGDGRGRARRGQHRPGRHRPRRGLDRGHRLRPRGVELPARGHRGLPPAGGGVPEPVPRPPRPPPELRRLRPGQGAHLPQPDRGGLGGRQRRRPCRAALARAGRAPLLPFHPRAGGPAPEGGRGRLLRRRRGAPAPRAPSRVFPLHRPPPGAHLAGTSSRRRPRPGSSARRRRRWPAR